MSIEDAFELTPAQQGMLYQSLRNSSSDPYRSLVTFDICGQLQTDLLKKSWNLILKKHAILRASVAHEKFETPLLVIRENILPEWIIIDISAHDKTTQQHCIEETIKTVTNRGIDFQNNALLSLALFKITDKKHKLILFIHHLIADGQSIPIIVDDLSDIYADLNKGATPEITNAFSYKTYTEFQRKNKSRSESYWRNYLSSAETTELKCRPHYRQETESHTSEYTSIESDLLRDISVHYQVTTTTLLTALSSLVISYLAQTNQPLFGIAVAGRPAELEGVNKAVGHFTSVLPISVNVNSTESIKEWVHHIQRTLVEHQENQYLSVHEISKLSKDRGEAPLFDSVLSIQSDVNLLSSNTRANDDDSRLQVTHCSTYVQSHYPLSILITVGKNLNIRIQCDNKIIQKATQHSIAYLLHCLCRNIADRDLHSVKDLVAIAHSNLSDSNRYPLYNDGIYSKACPHATIAEWFQASVTENLTTPAIVSGGSCISYRSLNEKANDFSRFLQAIEHDRNQAVAVYLTPSINFIVCIIGTLKYGGYYLPIDHKTPVNRVDSIIADASAGCIIVDHRSDTFPDSWNEFTFADVDEYAPNIPETNSLSKHTNRDDLAYLMYTSGSTGSAKGVKITNANLISSNWARINYYRSPVERYLLLSSINFDSSVAGIYWTLLCGGTLYLTEPEDIRDVDRLISIIATKKITHTLCLPSVYKILIEKAKTKDLESLDVAIVAGERCDVDLVRKHHQSRADKHLYNEYGPTEACVWSTVYECKHKDIHTVPIGSPIAGTRIEIRNKNLIQTGIGIEGELYIFGPGISPGYNHQSDKSEAFLNESLKTEINSETIRGYRTGDLGYWNKDGTITYTGRADRQIKIRGHRVEPAEVETAITNFKAIDRAAVIYTERLNRQSKSLIAFYTLHDKSQPLKDLNPDQIKNYLASKLPHYMIPTAFHVIHGLPTLPNGKISHNALIKQLEINAVEVRAVDDEISDNLSDKFLSPAKRAVLQTLTDTFETTSLNLKNSFIDNGGDSIMAMRLCAKLSENFNCKVSLKQVMETAALNILVENIAGKQIHTENQSNLDKKQSLSLEHSPLSFNQRAIWFMEQLGVPSALYAVCSSHKFNGSIDIDATQNALNQLVTKHQILRTVYLTDNNGDPYQKVKNSSSVELVTIPADDLTTTIEEDQIKALDRPFDFTSDIFLRAIVYTGSYGDTLFLHSHHIAMDGWAFETLHKNFSTLYNNILTQDANPADNSIETKSLEPNPRQYIDYAIAENLKIENGDFDDSIKFWKNILSLPLPVSSIKKQTLNGAEKNKIVRTDDRFSGDNLDREIPSHVIKKFEIIAKKQNTTQFVTYLAAYYVFLYGQNKQHEQIIGTLVANRDETDWQNELGFFSNVLALRMKVDSSTTFRKYISSVRDTVNECFEHRHLPFEKIVNDILPERSLHIHPIFQILFLYQNATTNAVYLSGLESVPAKQLPMQQAKYDFALEIQPGTSSVSGNYTYRINYRTALFSKDQVTKLADYFDQLLNRLCKNIDEPIADALKHTETTLSAGNLTELQHRTYARPSQSLESQGLAQNLFDIFWKQCLERPESTALIHHQEHYSYRTLADATNNLAEYLVEIGCARGEIICIELPRSIAYVASILATLKIGAIWCPVDPDYPDERKSFMLEDSGSRIVIREATNELLSQPRNSDTGSTYLSKSTCVYIVPGPDKLSFTLSHTGVTRKENKEYFGECALRDQQGAAYLIYTSGSSGKPKGVVGTLKAINNRLTWMWTQYPFLSNEVNSLKTATSFVDSIWETLGALLKGVPSVIYDNNALLDIAAFAESLEKHKITRIVLVPSLLSALIKQLNASDARLPNLLYVASSGESLPAPLAKDFFNRFKGATLINLYGSSEVAGDVTFYEVQNESTDSKISLGKPISNTRIYVVDENGNQLDENITGEIVIGGHSVALGYHRQPELTSKSFIVDANSLTTSFRTGDSGYLDDSGNLFYQGRLDSQLKVRGFRIDANEIVDHINRILNIDNSQVFTRGNLDESQLIAVVSPPSIYKPSIKTLKQQLKNSLPAYMVPDIVHSIDTFPLLPNGKIDRNAIKKTIDKKYGNVSSVSNAHIPDMYLKSKSDISIPNNKDDALPIAKQIIGPMIEQWHQLLNYKNLTINDNFFDIGGHSLMAVKLTNRINNTVLKKHGLSMSVADLFEAPTIAELMQLIAPQNDNGLKRQRSVMKLKAGNIHDDILRVLFIVPPAAHTGVYFRKLSSFISDEIPFYSFDTSICVECSSVEELASHMVQDILSIQPQGPYLIGAACLGSVIAFEIARQIEQATGEVSHLVFIDTSAPLNGPNWNKKDNTKLKKATKKVRFIKMLKSEYQHDYATSYLRRKLFTQPRLIKRAIRNIKSKYSEHVRNYMYVQNVQSTQFNSYYAKQISSDITLILSRQFRQKSIEIERWQYLTHGSCDIYPAKADNHFDLVHEKSRHWSEVAQVLESLYKRLANQNNPVAQNNSKAVPTDTLYRL